MSKMLDETIKEISKGNMSVKEKFRLLRVSMYLRATEFCAQKFAYCILGISWSQCSRDNVGWCKGLKGDTI